VCGVRLDSRERECGLDWGLLGFRRGDGFVDGPGLVGGRQRGFLGLRGHICVVGLDNGVNGVLGVVVVDGLT